MSKSWRQWNNFAGESFPDLSGSRPEPIRFAARYAELRWYDNQKNGSREKYALSINTVHIGTEKAIGKDSTPADLITNFSLVKVIEGV